MAKNHSSGIVRTTKTRNHPTYDQWVAIYKAQTPENQMKLTRLARKFAGVAA